MSDLPRSIYDRTTNHLKDALRQLEFAVRLPGYEGFKRLRWKIRKDGRSDTYLRAEAQHNPSHLMNAFGPDYGYVTIRQLVGLFGDRLPPWLWSELSEEDKRLASSTFEDQVQNTNIAQLWGRSLRECADSVSMPLSDVESLVIESLLRHREVLFSFIASRVESAEDENRSISSQSQAR
ncbi:hypothetical protein FFLO_05963 [Filobasidium floriforme]|uniref:Uncharacterized protein n=1 Tax=Filobasidium floriforme TaxID=5210 RepID=A0A8K0JGE3_9TREE|nr:uncharacterized protein HD553DRAFT_346733 [Filobasidium floriforme]KAG7528737.1 hypothetical protein FFLO_05963 [Filobasidium floriforme]KAH8077284.1 hypothetical protein HD553DRAFT_346733 [Filobasidium floriforme]